MTDRTYNCDVLIIGAGPAGMAAACSAAESGRRVTIIDDNPTPGGQIWRGEEAKPSSREAIKWFRKIESLNAELISGARVVDQPQSARLTAETYDAVLDLTYERLIIATGARECFLPFPGWTLPNVFGAGGLQSLVKSGYPISGKKVVVAGSGPLLPAVAAYLKNKGADVVLIAEQAPFSRLLKFGLGLISLPGKIFQAIGLQRQLVTVPYIKSCWPVTAHGEEKLTGVTLRQGEKIWHVDCDYLACGFHLVPNTELPEMLGCTIDNGVVQVDDYQQTSQPGIFCAGESTGIGGLELSLTEGQIAGFASAGNQDAAIKIFAERDKHRRFARGLNEAFTLRDELKLLPEDGTIVCRCEDVTFARLKNQRSWRDAKLQTRCGMGPCQGRICGPATEFLLGWGMDSVRPPVFAARVESLTNPE